MAVVAVCIAYKQLTVTQCGITGEYAIIQNYVACGYVAVFIYNQFAVGSIECTVAVYKERYSAVFICSTYGQVVFCVQCVGLNGVYTGNVAFFIDSYLTKFSGFRSDLAVVAVCIAYKQLTVTQCGITGEYAIIQNYVACGYVAVFIYNQFAAGCIECTVAVYKERHSSVFCHSTYGQIVFGIQYIGLNGVCIYIRCRSSHRRSHACTGHNTCCNQHCQQLFGRAAFTAMIFCDFGDNNICVARLTSNYFKYFVHKEFLPHKYYYLYTVRDTCHV